VVLVAPLVWTWGPWRSFAVYYLPRAVRRVSSPNLLFLLRGPFSLLNTAVITTIRGGRDGAGTPLTLIGGAMPGTLPCWTQTGHLPLLVSRGWLTLCWQATFPLFFSKCFPIPSSLSNFSVSMCGWNHPPLGQDFSPFLKCFSLMFCVSLAAAVVDSGVFEFISLGRAGTRRCASFQFVQPSDACQLPTRGALLRGTLSVLPEKRARLPPRQERFLWSHIRWMSMSEFFSLLASSLY